MLLGVGIPPRYANIRDNRIIEELRMDTWTLGPRDKELGHFGKSSNGS